MSPELRVTVRSRSSMSSVPFRTRKIVRVVMLMPVEWPLQLCHHNVVTAVSRNCARREAVGESRELFGGICGCFHCVSLGFVWPSAVKYIWRSRRLTAARTNPRAPRGHARAPGMANSGALLDRRRRRPRLHHACENRCAAGAEPKQATGNCRAAEGRQEISDREMKCTACEDCFWVCESIPVALGMATMPAGAAPGCPALDVTHATRRLRQGRSQG